MFSPQTKTTPEVSQSKRLESEGSETDDPFSVKPPKDNAIKVRTQIFSHQATWVGILHVAFSSVCRFSNKVIYASF